MNIPRRHAELWQTLDMFHRGQAHYYSWWANGIFIFRGLQPLNANARKQHRGRPWLLCPHTHLVPDDILLLLPMEAILFLVSFLMVAILQWHQQLFLKTPKVAKGSTKSGTTSVYNWCHEGIGWRDSSLIIIKKIKHCIQSFDWGRMSTETVTSCWQC